MAQYLPQPQDSETHILSCHQLVVIEQGYLYASPANIHDRRPLFYKFIKILSFKRDRLIAEESLLRVAEYPYFDPRALLDLIQNNACIFRLADSARAVGPVFRYPVTFHNLRILVQVAAQFIHPFARHFSRSIGFRSQVDPVADMIDLPHTGLGRYFEYLHGQFKRTHINRRKCFHPISCLSLIIIPAFPVLTNNR